MYSQVICICEKIYGKIIFYCEKERIEQRRMKDWKRLEKGNFGLWKDGNVICSQSYPYAYNI